MKFSDEFGIQHSSSPDWFDPVLSIDTKLFIDPFLLYAREYGVFLGSHDEIIDFFNDIFSLIAKTKGDPNHFLWCRAEDLLVFPEVQELCLGYASGSTRGAGSGRGFSRIIAYALWEAVEAGITHFSHFEEIGILREGIGADRISDITANLLRHRFAKYTEGICLHYKIKAIDCPYYRGKYSVSEKRWLPETFQLPLNPYNERPILLCPTRFIRELPTISADEFWDYCYYNENETLRNEFGADITRNVDKKTIIEFARKHHDLRSQFVNDLEKENAQPYDYERDKKGLIKWYDEAALYCNRTPHLLCFSNQDEFTRTIETFIFEFKNFVENNRGWALLWNDNKTPKSEEAAQLLFLGIVKHYCRANNIDISKEANIGRGPVDFKTAQGYENRSLLELKLARNTKFWNGIEKQLPKYQQAESVSVGFFIVVAHTSKDFERLRDIEMRVKEVRDRSGYDIHHIIVDASYAPKSASKL